MKKLLIAALAVLMILSLAACTGKKDTGGNENKATETEKGTGGTEDITEGLGIANPVVVVDSSDAFKDIGLNLVARPGAENVVYSIIDGKIANIDFVYKGHEYTSRAAKTDEDISGLYGEVVREVDTGLWGESNGGGPILREISDGENTFLSLTWTSHDETIVLINTDGATDMELLETITDLVD